MRRFVAGAAFGAGVVLAAVAFVVFWLFDIFDDVVGR